MDKENIDYIAKYIIIGDSQTGKSSLGLKYSRNQFFNDTSSTIGIDLFVKNVDIDGKKLKIQIWDTAGQERFISLIQSIYRNVKCVLFCFDVTNINTFNNLNFWIKQSLEFLDKNCIKCIVGTKIDLQNNRKVEYLNAMIFAAKNNMVYYEISSKNNNGIDELFNNLNLEVVNKLRKSVETSKIQYFNKKVEKKICCY